MLKRLMWMTMPLLLTACQSFIGNPMTPKPINNNTNARQSAIKHTELASEYFRSGNIRIAYEEAIIAVGADPSYAHGHNMAGIVHQHLGQYDQAKTYFEQALAIAPDEPEINNNFGSFLCATEREQESLTYFLHAAHNPLYITKSLAFANASRCASRLGETDLTVNYAASALKEGLELPHVLYTVARALLNVRILDRAWQAIAALNRKFTPTALSLDLAIRIAQARQDQQTATRLMEQLKRKFPKFIRQRGPEGAI